jgi:hypothetical protein
MRFRSASSHQPWPSHYAHSFVIVFRESIYLDARRCSASGDDRGHHAAVYVVYDVAFVERELSSRSSWQQAARKEMSVRAHVGVHVHVGAPRCVGSVFVTMY